MTLLSDKPSEMYIYSYYSTQYEMSCYSCRLFYFMVHDHIKERGFLKLSGAHERKMIFFEKSKHYLSILNISMIIRFFNRFYIINYNWYDKINISNKGTHVFEILISVGRNIFDCKILSHLFCLLCIVIKLFM